MIDERLIEIFKEWDKAYELKKDRLPTKFETLMKKYEEKFNDNVPNEEFAFSEEEWCEILEECLEKNITVVEMYGMEDESEDY